MAALSATNVEEVQSILQDLEEDMMFEEEGINDYTSLCEGIDFDTEMSEGEEDLKMKGKGTKNDPILIPFTSYEKKDDEPPLLCQSISNNNRDIDTDTDLMDDSIFNMLFNDLDVDNLSKDEIGDIVEATNNSLADDPTYKPMSSQEMKSFIEDLFCDVTGEQTYETTTSDTTEVCA